MLLDTDIFIDLLRGRSEAKMWIAGLSPSAFLSGVAALEAMFGARDTSDLEATRRACSDFVIIWPEAEDLERAALDLASLRLAHGIGLLDAVTAALALRHGLPLATFNTKHFRAVPGLTIVTPPYARP